MFRCWAQILRRVKSDPSLTPRNAGESPIIYYSTKPEVMETDPKVDDLENFSTTEGTLYFWVKDTTGKYESGPPARWVADLKIRHQIEPSADKRKVTLQCTPKAEMYYTLDGSNPKDGKPYDRLRLRWAQRRSAYWFMQNQVKQPKRRFSDSA